MTKSRISIASFRIGSCVLLILFAVPGIVFAPVAPPSDPNVPADWLGKVTGDIRKSEYHFVRQEKGVFSAPNRAHDLRVRVSGSGIEVVSRTKGEDPERGGWKLGLALRAVSPAQPSADKNRVELKRGALTEWYVNTEKGIEQGFTIDRQPERDNSASPVVIEMTLSGGLVAKLSEDGQAVTFTRGSGEPVVRYGELQVHDAGGRTLDARLELSAGSLEILINDHGTLYPITVDPLMTSPAWTAYGDQDGADFGFSVATAGDVNGDGYSDVIVGAKWYGGVTCKGRAYVYHGSASGLSLSPAWTADSGQDRAVFGFSVATAGDVNGDGYSDVIVGAPDYDNVETDEGGAFVYHGSASGLSPAPAWTAESDQAGAFFGRSVGTAGDVNGDGYSDVIVGDPDYDNGEADEGRAFVYHGSASGLSPAPAWTAESDQAGALFGYSVATAGDVNGDGYADVVVGAYQYDNLLGGAFVFHGSASGLGAAAACIVEGSQAAGFMLGQSVATAGDVNGDGFSDVVVGALGWSNGQLQEGRALVYHGSASGLLSTSAWAAEGDRDRAYFGCSVATAGDVNGDGFADVIVGAYEYDLRGAAFVYLGSASGLSAAAAWTAESNKDLSAFGYSVAMAGDVNGDGYSDVIVGCPYYDNGETDEGRAYVYYGFASGVSPGAAWTAESDQVYSYFGYSVSTAGDVNGDGYSDVIVGANEYSNGESCEGRAYVYHGSASGLSLDPAWTGEGDQPLGNYGSSVATAGDVNGDGYTDVIVGAPYYGNNEPNQGRVFVYHGSPSGLSATAAWTVPGDQAIATFGDSVSTAGDVNGDGYCDVIVGARYFSNGEGSEGQAFVYHGSPSGLSPAAAWIGESNQANAQFGYSVATAGDVNCDGYSDVIIGACFFTNGEQHEGRAYVYHGSASGLSSVPAWTAELNQAQASFGWPVGTAGDVNGDGYSDVIVGAQLYTNGSIYGGWAFVYYGSASGVSLTPAWTAEGDQDGADLGSAAATAGDVNGDGYSDVIVGAPRYDNGESDEGRAYVYHGSASGLSPTAGWLAEGNQNQVYFGLSVATAGDVNGDGYSDIIVGADHYDNGQENEGRAFVYYGNGGDGLDRIPRQARADRTAPIDLLGLAHTSDGFLLRANGRTPFGRDRVRLEWEVKPLGTPYDLADVKTSGWLNTGAPGASGSFVPIEQPEAPLPADGPYKWRLRLRSRFPFPWQSHWMSLPYNCVTETDLRASAYALRGWKTMTDEDDGELNAGDTLRFNMGVENTGALPVTGIIVVDTVDPNVENLDAPDGSVNGNRITWDRNTMPGLASLAPGDSAVWSFTGTVSCAVADGTPICNEDGDWSISMNDSGFVTRTSPDCLTVAMPVLSASVKEIDPASLPAQAGSTVHYIIRACNEGSGTGTNVVVTDTLDASLDQTTIVAPGAAVAGNTITWTIPTIGPGSVGTPTCQSVEFWVNVGAGVADGTQICNLASVTSDEWTACGGSFATNRPCFTTESGNELLREWCSAVGPACDLTAIWNPDLDPYPLSLPRAPASINDPETGILTDLTKQLVFYEVTNPSSANSVRCMKNAAGQTVTVLY